jgi:ATP-dependent RNA helicase DDX18/HAS1
MNQYELPENKVANVQAQLEKLVEKNYFLNKSARDAYRGYLLAYASHGLKEIFDVYKLDLQVSLRGLLSLRVVVFSFLILYQAVAKGLGFSTPPRVNLNLKAAGTAPTRRTQSAGPESQKHGNKKFKATSGHAFSASNPYGKRVEGDKRQFVRY